MRTRGQPYDAFRRHCSGQPEKNNCGWLRPLRRFRELAGPPAASACPQRLFSQSAGPAAHCHRFAFVSDCPPEPIIIVNPLQNWVYGLPSGWHKPGRPPCAGPAATAGKSKSTGQSRRYMIKRSDGRKEPLSGKMQKKLHLTQECGIHRVLDVGPAPLPRCKTCRFVYFVADRATAVVCSRPEILGESMAREDWVHSSFTRRNPSIIILATAFL